MIYPHSQVTPTVSIVHAEKGEDLVRKVICTTSQIEIRHRRYRHADGLLSVDEPKITFVSALIHSGSEVRL